MAQNLNYNATGSKCYDNSETNCTTYGRLYTWSTAMTACPSGWHLPSDAEWTTLTDFVGGRTTAGTKLKAKSGWNNYSGKSGNGTDDYGFAALPGGYGYSDGDFDNVGKDGNWWSATEGSASGAWGRYMYYSYAYVDRFSIGKTGFTSVRCVQD
jgi:uncharacterized protein (TIGR02145 family)